MKKHALTAALCAALTAPAAAQTTINIGIGTQNTTTNTVTSGAVIKELGLLEKHLSRTGKYANVKYTFDWQNFTSGPPLTNGMMANKLHIGSMGDYPLVVNGYTFQSNPESRSLLIAISAYNMLGAGNGLVVHKDSPYYAIDDLKGKLVTVPFGSAAHGMILKAMQDRGWPQNFWQLASQTPEVGSTNLQEKKIDGHANFVPFAELLPFRGFARKIFDGVETNAPTFHGVVVRSDFAEKYPEVVVAFLKANIEANDWMKANPKLAAEKIEQWTKIDKEVVYIFLGPGGLMTLDPTIKPALVEDAANDAKVLQNLGRMKEFDVQKWVDDRYIRQAFKELGRDYDAQLAKLDNYEVAGHDAYCNKPIAEPRKAGEIWFAGGDIQPFSSARCTLAALADMQRKGQKSNVAYVFDDGSGLKLFADQAFYAIGPGKGDAIAIAPYMLKKDAAAKAQAIGGKAGTFADALAAVSAGG